MSRRLIRRQSRRCSRGSISLEAALAMPLVLVVLFSFLCLLAALAAETRLKGALDKTAAELSLLCPLADLVLTQADPILDWTGKTSPDTLPAPAEEAGDLALLGHDLLTDEQLSNLIFDGLLDLASSVLLAPFIHQRVRYWLEESQRHQPLFMNMLGQKKLYLDFRLSDQQLWLSLVYDLHLPLRKIRRHTQVVVPLWIGSGEEAGQGNPDSVWMLDNFSRGQVLRQHYGANLPYDFPVIARFADGKVSAIKSMDLTAPTYSRQEQVFRRLRQQFGQVAAFRGAVRRRGDQEWVISADEVSSRQLILVIPENSPAPARKWLETLVREAHQQGVDLSIRRHGVSHRYLSESDPDFQPTP